MTEHMVFVYGTLKHGQSNNSLLHDATYVGRATTIKPYLMKTTGGYPVVFDIRRHNVAGEVYEVNDEILKRLDSLEGHPYLFERREIVVDVQDTGIPLTAWMYFGNDINPAYLKDVPANSVGAYVWSRQ